MAILNGVNLSTPFSPGSGSTDIAFEVINANETGSLFRIGGDGATTISGSLTVTGSLTAGSFTGSITGTSSYATQALSASFAISTSAVAGTTNYIPKFTSGTAVGNSVIYESGSNIGIGTTSPLAKLDTFGAGIFRNVSDLAQLSIGGTANTNSIKPYTTGTPIRFSNTSNGYANIGAGAISIGSSYAAISASANGAIFEGNVGIGTVSPTAKLHVAAPGALSTDIGFKVRNSADTADIITVAGNGNVNLENLTLQRSTNLQIQLAWQLNQGAGNSITVYRNNYGVGDTIRYSSAGLWNPSGVGTSNFAGFSFTDTIAQTGSSTGTSRALYVNPILTSATDWRSIEWTNNTGFGLYGSGDAVNYLKSGLGIGKTSPNAKLDVSGSAIITGSLNVTQGITGSLLGTSSYATQALSSSYADTASYYGGSVTSASYATTASYVNPLVQNVQLTGSLNVTNGNSIVNLANGSILGKVGNIDYFKVTGSSTTGGVLEIAHTNTTVVGQLTGNSGGAGNGLNLGFYNLLNLRTLNSSITITANAAPSWRVYSGMNFSFEGYSAYGDPNGGEVIMKDALTGAEAFHAYLGASQRIIMNSSSLAINQSTPGAKLDIRTAGNLSTDLGLRIRNNANTADLFSIAGNGSAIISGSLNVTQGITGSLLGTSSYATQALSSSFSTTASYYGGSVTSASYAATASYVLNAVSASYATQALSSSFATSTAAVAGTANYVPKFATSTTLGNSVIYESGSNIGIGTTLPASKLDVTGTTTFSADAYGYVSIIPTSGNNGTAYITQGTNTPRNGGNLAIRVNAYVQGGNFSIETNGSERFRILAAGNVGIGTTNPSAKFHVVAPGALSTDLGLRVRNSADTGDLLLVTGNGGTQVGVGGLSIPRTDSPGGSLVSTITYATSGLTRFTTGIEVPNGLYGSTTTSTSILALELGYYGIALRNYGGATNTGFSFSNSVATTGTYYMRMLNGGTDVFNISSTGNVGIGKTTASTRLDISGSVAVTGSVLVSTTNQTLGQFVGNTNGYSEFSVRNTNTGISASGDIAVYADNGTVTNNYIDMGINNSGLSPTYFYGGTDFGNANDAYVYNVGGNLRIGNATSVAPYSQSFYLFSNPSATPDIAITGSKVGIGISSSMTSKFTVYGSGSSVVSILGSQGELFSITDSLSGSLFSVNDISGLPIMEVFSDNTTLMGSYQDPMLITTTKVTQTNSGSFTVYSLPTASYDTAFFEYSIRSGSNARAGTIMAMQLGSTVNFTETTTTDFGSTSAVSFTVIVTGSNMALTGSSTSGAWTIKTIVRGI